MRIKHITLMAGPSGTFTAGTVRDIDDVSGRQLVAGGYAVEIEASPAPETADRRAPETAEAPAARARGRGKPPAQQDPAAEE